MFWNENDWSKYDCLSCGCDRDFLYRKGESLLWRYLSVVVPGVVCYTPLHIIGIVKSSCWHRPSAL
jgi:hypothetical protein